MGRTCLKTLLLRYVTFCVLFFVVVFSATSIIGRSHESVNTVDRCVSYFQLCRDISSLERNML